MLEKAVSNHEVVALLFYAFGILKFFIFQLPLISMMQIKAVIPDKFS